MKVFAERLRTRAAILGLSNAEVARRLDLSERRYAHYVTGAREPDLATLVRIARSLGSNPNELLGFEDARSSKRSQLFSRLVAAVEQLSDRDLEMFVNQAEAIGLRQPRPARRSR